MVRAGKLGPKIVSEMFKNLKIEYGITPRKICSAIGKEKNYVIDLFSGMSIPTEDELRLFKKKFGIPFMVVLMSIFPLSMFPYAPMEKSILRKINILKKQKNDE